MKDKDIEAIWAKNVNEARAIMAAKSYSQMEIARLAVESCEITRGGAAQKSSLFTIKKFAKEVGVNVKTLSMWICILRNVYDKLDVDLRFSASYTTCMTASKTTSPDDSPERVRAKVRKLMSATSLDAKIGRYLGTLRSLSHNFESRDVAERVDKKILEECAYFCEQILDNIRKVRRGIRPQFHGISSQYDTKTGVSASSTKRFLKDDLGFRVVITQSDLRTHDFMKKNKAATPSQVGDALYRQIKSPVARKLRALRSLQKLKGLDCLTAEKGKYVYQKQIPQSFAKQQPIVFIE